MIAAYLTYGVGFWTGASFARLSYFHEASVFSILRGAVLGIFFWPIAAIVLFIDYTVEKQKV